VTVRTTSGFEEVAFYPVPHSVASVGVHRLVADPLPYRSGAKLFTFTRGPAAR
jgi:hypothetical protein